MDQIEIDFDPGGADEMATFSTPSSIRDDLQAELRRQKISQATLAGQLDIAKSSLSEWIAQKLNGVRGTDIERRVAEWLAAQGGQDGRAARPMIPAPPEWIDTPTSAAVMDTLRYAHMLGAMALVFGGWGVGKTHAIRRYAQEAGRTYVVTASPVARTPSALLDTIAEAIGMRQRQRRAAGGLARSITQWLQGQQSLLVIDEAQLCSHDGLETVRSLHDATGCGVVFSGNATLREAIYGSGRDEPFAQLFSRVAKRLHIKRPRAGDVEMYAGHYGVSDPKALRLCQQVADQEGGLRALKFTLTQAAVMAAGGDGQVTPALIKAAHKGLKQQELVEPSASPLGGGR